MSVPANNSGLEIIADRNRSGEWDVRIGKADGTDEVFTAGDKVHVKIGGGKSTPLLQFNSSTATANGSSCTLANPTRVKLNQNDLTFPAGIYDIEVSIIDHADGDKIKKAEMGVFHLRESMGGVVT